jgi:hypothetical protein
MIEASRGLAPSVHLHRFWHEYQTAFRTTIKHDPAQDKCQIFARQKTVVQTIALCEVQSSPQKAGFEGVCAVFVFKPCVFCSLEVVRCAVLCFQSRQIAR